MKLPVLKNKEINNFEILYTEGIVCKKMTVCLNPVFIT